MRWPSGVKIEVESELGIDVGYIRQIKGRGSSTMGIVTAAVGPVGKSPRIWASARTRTKPLHDDMNKFLVDSGYGAEAPVRVITDGAKDLKKVSQALPRAGSWVLDWAHIGRMIHHLDQALSPFVFSKVPLSRPRFDLWDACVHLRSYVWTGQKRH